MAQFLLPTADTPAPTVALAIRHPRPVVVPPIPEYPAILRSPIFAPDRKPGAADLSSSSGGPLATYSALGAAAGRGAAAAVVSSPGGGIKTLRVGDMLDDWRLAGVSGTQLVFERKGERRVLVVGAPADAVTQSTSTAAGAAQQQ